MHNFVGICDIFENMDRAQPTCAKADKVSRLVLRRAKEIQWCCCVHQNSISSIAVCFENQLIHYPSLGSGFYFAKSWKNVLMIRGRSKVGAEMWRGILDAVPAVLVPLWTYSWDILFHYGEYGLPQLKSRIQFKKWYLVKPQSSSATNWNWGQCQYIYIYSYHIHTGLTSYSYHIYSLHTNISCCIHISYHVTNLSN